MSEKHEVTGQLADALKAFEALDHDGSQAMAIGGQRIGDKLASLINLLTQLGSNGNLGKLVSTITLLTKVLTIIGGTASIQEKIAAIVELAKSLLGGTTDPAPAALSE